MSGEKTHFVLGDKLPTVYDAAISIFEVATQPDLKKNISILAKNYVLYKNMVLTSLTFTIIRN